MKENYVASKKLHDFELLFDKQKTDSEKMFEDFFKNVNAEIQRKLDSVKNRFALSVKESILNQEDQIQSGKVFRDIEKVLVKKIDHDDLKQALDQKASKKYTEMAFDKIKQLHEISMDMYVFMSELTKNAILPEQLENINQK